MSRLGLQQAPPGPARIRPATKGIPKRDSMVWKSVNILSEHATSPSLQCNNCDFKFCGGATRIKDHITGMGEIRACDCESDAFLDLKQRLVDEKGMGDGAKKQKVAEAQVEAAANTPTPGVKSERKLPLGQIGIRASMASGIAEDVDNSVADFFYGCNVAPATVEHPLFKAMLASMRTAPASYKTPTRQRLSGDLLDSTTQRLKAAEAPVREVVLKDCGTVVSDGWDDVAKNHLINFLVGTSKGFFFDGTIMLEAADSENAERVAELIIDEIKRVGKYTIIQVVTDTCSVMKAAWKIIENEFAWITCTCCGPHVLSLELSDMGKVPEVAAVIKKVGRVLNRFWGRKRWSRMKLREVAEKNHKKKIGLYRAKLTRFAGKVREMARMLRLKADLQEVAISAEYGAHKWNLTVKEKEALAADEEAEEETDDGEDAIKKILFDEPGFWKPLVEALKVMTPIVKLLRLMDGEKPAMGKVYDRMCIIGAKMEERDFSWKAKAIKIHSDRWEYIHSPMHAAGYALDPEHMAMVDLDEATQTGLMLIIERVCLRDLKAAAVTEADADALTMANDAVQTRVASTMVELATFQQREGVFTKPYVVANAKCMAPATWWDTYGKHLPLLSSVARRVLAQPVCASAAERNWSIYGAIKTSARGTMGHAVADKRVYCHEALHMQSKFQVAAYKQAVEKWDSDSDSDSSDEEDLMV